MLSCRIGANRLRKSLICVGHAMRSRKVAGLELGYPKSCGGDELVDLSIEVTTARNTLPERREPFLPDSYTKILEVPH